MKSCRRIYDGWFTLGGVLRISNQSGQSRLASNNNVSNKINSKKCGPSAILSNLTLTIYECSPTLQQENKRTPFLMFNHVFPISFGLKCLKLKSFHIITCHFGVSGPVHVILLQELIHHIGAIGVRHALVHLVPPRLMILRVRPQQVANQAIRPHLTATEWNDGDGGVWNQTTW